MQKHWFAFVLGTDRPCDINKNDDRRNNMSTMSDIYIFAYACRFNC